ncbi:MAG: hypothetical protein F7B60_02760, partial [Desulfurococcales archaeon]|nr:hypothetical protein [Desulfurococcales archaeon]
EKNRLVREILIRKSRGSPLTIARVPFAITEKGLRVWAPPSLETIPPLEESRTFKMPCNVVNRYLDGLFGGTSIYISYPPDARPPRILGFTFLTGFLNDAKLLFITFRTPPSQIKEIIFNELVKKACKELREGEFKQYIERRVKYLSFNPSAFSLEELYNRLLYIIGNIKPEIVVFLGLDSVTLEDRSHFDLLMNLMLHLKIRGMLIFNLVAHADNLAAHADNSGMEYMYYSRIADVVGRYIYYYDEREGKFKYNFYLWKQGLDPIILSYEKLVECNEDMVSLTRKCVGHSP